MIKCNECKSGPLKGGLYVGDRGPLCNSCFTKLCTGHTVGPWEVLELPQMSCASARISAMGEVVAHATPLSLRDQRDANARLISAAPELLEAAKLARQYIQSGSGVVIEMLNDVIAKAEGRRRK